MNAIQLNFTLEIPYNNVVQTMELASFNQIWNSIYLLTNYVRYKFGSAGEVWASKSVGFNNTKSHQIWRLGDLGFF